jgi:predicted DNA-binding transcriptional regulator YafY
VPLLLKEYRNRWYLISLDLDKKQVMTYALERMSDVLILEEKGEKPLDFDADLFFKHSIGITSSEDEPSTIIFKADNVSSKYIISQPFHSSQIVLKEGKLKVLISEEFIRTILSYAGGIEIVEPIEFREEIIARVAEMMKHYNL